MDSLPSVEDPVKRLMVLQRIIVVMTVLEEDDEEISWYKRASKDVVKSLLGFVRTEEPERPKSVTPMFEDNFLKRIETTELEPHFPSLISDSRILKRFKTEIGDDIAEDVKKKTDIVEGKCIQCGQSPALSSEEEKTAFDLTRLCGKCLRGMK